MIRDWSVKNDKYILIGQTPVPEPDLLTWALAFEKMDRRVMLTRVLGICEVERFNADSL